jgi:hypothetical protein
LKSPSTTFGPVTRGDRDDARQTLVDAPFEDRVPKWTLYEVQHRPPRSTSTRWQQRGSHVFHDRSNWV